MAELHDLPAVVLRDQLRQGEVSASDAAAHFLARIERQNPLLGSFITVTAEQALEQARAADTLRLRVPADELPPLHGMPLAFKDLTDVAGVVTTHGSAALDHRPAPTDSPLVALLREAGVTSLGKTQVPEFGLTAYSENRIAPPSRNPHALSRSSGGSSGGSAAAVAAGLLPFAPGTDGGGSIRIPAAACGLVGLKPGRGLVPAGESLGDPARLVVAGPLARTSADAALMLDALAPSPATPDSGAVNTGSYLAALSEDPPRLRIGVTLDSPWWGTFPFSPEPAALDALKVGQDLLEHAGHVICEASIRYDNRYPDAFTTAWTAPVGTARISPHREALLAPLTRTFRRRAQQRSPAKLAEALAFLRRFQHDTVVQYAQWDLMLMPALAQTPRPVGWFTGALHGDDRWPAAQWPGDADGDYRRQCEYAPWSSMVNVCGLPAITLPVHWTGGGRGEGLPMGIQLVGPMGSESLLLRVSNQLGF
ncbi:amidase, Asp-tRNAAsn/Glu-tRNAGln amidotransferase A subunit [Pseudarthrobacter phenanthrenivorans Sphe3]|uniref:Amidase, Asp-tRNAAsn/Glu-tRNAGln amidotransferase A subunit n=1 Tax=Pseudarthrobacter phenanthrenivorans (strain DSM 18606 / JCM 16027 / LMG 23796 / Sphe3) TaxID=930171 RepID=F0M7T5_PSEPM|nr:amidase [Pseudarthrobacter phenanthrenivorans]ADX71488.1 amidase, Asp-tRNAAsn/Glu-tRNAGln amidotransferase A subunit [Pseudarthrobacter phenanthrenivorans Sphe3]